MKNSERKITIPVSIGYGLTDIMGGGAFTVIGAWLLFYYTTFVGLSPLEAASIVAIARIVDAIISLFMGTFTDHFYKNRLGKKFGRRRFFLLIGSPLMLVYALLWLNGMNYWFYLSVYLAFEIIAAMVLIPWETLPSETIHRAYVSFCNGNLSRHIYSGAADWLPRRKECGSLSDKRHRICRGFYGLRIYLVESDLGARINAGNACRTGKRSLSFTGQYSGPF